MVKPWTLPAIGTFGRRFDTTVLRAISVVAIVNSHMDSLYPHRWMGEGGQIGNMGFFMASGLGLALSGRTTTIGFGRWYRRRLWRIYPSVLLILGVMYLLVDAAWRTWTPLDYVTHLIWPIEGYFFLTRIIVYYIPLYFFIRWSHPRKYLVLPAVALIVVAVSVPDMMRLHGADRLVIGELAVAHKWALGLFVCLLGAWIGQTADPSQWRFGRDIVVLAGLFAAYLVLKFAMVVKGIWPDAFLLQAAATVLVVLYLLRCTTNPQLLRAIDERAWLRWPLTLVGTISLEVYLVHMQMLPWPMWKQMGFPMNVPTFFLCTILLAWIAHQLAVQSAWPPVTWNPGAKSRNANR